MKRSSFPFPRLSPSPCGVPTSTVPRPVFVFPYCSRPHAYENIILCSWLQLSHYLLMSASRSHCHVLRGRCVGWRLSESVAYQSLTFLNDLQAPFWLLLMVFGQRIQRIRLSRYVLVISQLSVDLIFCPLGSE